jgi:hypothetical protein
VHIKVALTRMNTVNSDDQGEGVTAQLWAWTHRKLFRIEPPSKFIYSCNSQVEVLFPQLSS